ncbi:ATP-binding protein [Streptomyces sp. NPDC054841]
MTGRRPGPARPRALRSRGGEPPCTEGPFGRWGKVFGDDTVAAAMIDRLVHHAEVTSLKGDSYRMRGRDLARVPAANTGE